MYSDRGKGRLSAPHPGDVLAVLAAVAWPLNLAAGLDNGSRISRQMDALARDVRDGLPPALIGWERYGWQLFLNHPDIGWDLDTATRIGFAPFHDRGPVLETRTVPARVVTAGAAGGLRLERAAWPGGAGRSRSASAGKFVPPGERMADYRLRWQEAGDLRNGVRKSSGS